MKQQEKIDQLALEIQQWAAWLWLRWAIWGGDRCSALASAGHLGQRALVQGVEGGRDLHLAETKGRGKGGGLVQWGTVPQEGEGPAFRCTERQNSLELENTHLKQVCRGPARLARGGVNRPAGKVFGCSPSLAVF